MDELNDRADQEETSDDSDEDVPVLEAPHLPGNFQSGSQDGQYGEDDDCEDHSYFFHLAILLCIFSFQLFFGRRRRLITRNNFCSRELKDVNEQYINSPYEPPHIAAANALYEWPRYEVIFTECGHDCPSEAEPNNNKFLENESFMSIHGMK